MWTECAHCGAIFQCARDEQRFCCRTCARLNRYHGPLVDDNRVRAIAERCHRFVINAGDARGVTSAILARYVGEAYRNLSLVEREFVHLWIAKRNDIAHMVNSGEYRFWPRRCAPEEAQRA